MRKIVYLVLLFTPLIAAQSAPSVTKESGSQQESATGSETLKTRNEPPGLQVHNEAKPGGVLVASGTKVPLSLLNALSSKQTAEGDRVYLETIFPILVGGKIVIPPGSFVAGTVTQVKRPGRVKGRGELYLRLTP